MSLVFFAASVLMGLFFVLPMMTGGSLRHPLVQSLSQWCCWGLLFPLIAMMDCGLPYKARDFVKRILMHCLVSFPVTGIYIYVFFAVRAYFGDLPGSALRMASMFSWSTMGWFLWSWLIYCVIAAGLQAAHYHDFYLSSELRAERLERSYSEARLNALRMQLDPHFLFNTLNTISSHVESDPKLTRQMIEHLGDLLRISLATKDRQQISLSEEISFVEHYLAIQRIRFGEQLKVTIAIEAEVRTALLPALVIQPLVENSIRHGIAKRVSGGWVRIAAEHEGSMLHIVVEDDGVGLPSGWEQERSSGVGLSVTQERIALLHSATGSLRVTPRPEGGTRSEICIPFCTEESES